MPSEMIEVFDRHGKKKGTVETREEVHRRGLWHRTVHIWVHSGRKILLQRRSAAKDSHPGLWDVSAAGHIGTGESPLGAAVRETSEELGITPREDELVHIDTRRSVLVSRQGRFIDREFTYVYLYNFEKSMDVLLPDPEEIEELRFYETGLLKKSLEDGALAKSFVPHEMSYYMRVLGLVEEKVRSQDPFRGD